LSTPADDIRAFIHAKYPQAAIDDEQDIFSLGFVNSLFAMELVMFIEKQFGIRIPNEDLRLDNFRTITSMDGLVSRHAAAAAPAS
jgi:methoxymalonate biosynthesis acyl carrier protein